jgi:hypothetical protein
MIYTTMVVLLMVLSAVAKAIVIYFGWTEIMPMFNYMDDLIVVVLFIKASAVLINFTLGEIRYERQRKASFSN